MEEYEEEADCCPLCNYINDTDKGMWLEPGIILQGRYIVGTCRNERESDLLYIGWDAMFSRKILIQEFFPQYCATRDADMNLRVYDSKSELFEVGKHAFFQDGLKLITLDNSRNLLNILSVFEENNTAYMTMEYPGEITLGKILKEKGRMNEKQTLLLLKELAETLKAAHSCQVYHGEISPDCCYVVGENEFKLGCFNVSRYLCGEQKAGRERLGHPSERSDVYGLAVLAGTVLTGRRDWENYTEEKKGHLLSKNCTSRIAHILMCSVNHNPELRPESVENFCCQLWGDEIPFKVSKKRDGLKKLIFRGLGLFFILLITVVILLNLK
jgi:serine/threonine protein kinase